MKTEDKDLEQGIAVDGLLGSFNYQIPAISITERIGDKEVVKEFATSDDYKAWKALQD